MKKIIVFDVPAEGGGALAILNDFYSLVDNYYDKNIERYFVVSVPELKEVENISILKFPWVKKSWFHRIFLIH